MRTLQNSQNLENFAFPTTLRAFEEFFQETVDVVLKRPIGYRIQSFLNCKIVREVYKKVHKHFKIKKIDILLNLGCSDELFTHKIANLFKHSVCLLKTWSLRKLYLLLMFITSSQIGQTTVKMYSSSTILGSF